MTAGYRFALVRHSRSGINRKAELRFLRAFGDRFCPWLSAASPAVTDPARTEGSGRPLPSSTCFGPWSTRRGRSELVDEAGRTRWPSGREAGDARGPAHWRRGRGSAPKPIRRRGSGLVGGWPQQPPPPRGVGQPCLHRSPASLPVGSGGSGATVPPIASCERNTLGCRLVITTLGQLGAGWPVSALPACSRYRDGSRIQTAARIRSARVAGRWSGIGFWLI